jgi:hypothetical protein
MAAVTAVTPDSLAGARLDGPEFTSELLAALEQGIDLETYLAGRAGDLSHAELVEASRLSDELEFSLPEYVKARACGAARKDVVAFVEYRPKHLWAYAGLVAMGVTQAEIDEGMVAPGLDFYYMFREAGADHAQAFEALKSGVSGWSYANAREDGLSHAELMAAAQARVPMGIYTGARRAGATHDEVCAITAKHGADELGVYIIGRNVGATHDELDVALGRELDITSYIMGRKHGFDHVTLIAAVDRGLSLATFLHSRS